MTLPIGAASLLLGPAAGFITAGLIVALLTLDWLIFPMPTVTVSVVWMAGIMGFAIALLLWVATYPLRMTTQWAWTSYAQARKQTEETRRHRAELAQAVKELNAANQRLKTMALELERARQAANQARRLKAEFAANISHELRTPLNLIIGFSEMMALAPQTYGNVPLPAAYRGDVQSIYRSAKHLSSLIDDVLDLSQIEAGRMGLVKASVVLAHVITEATDTVAQLYQVKDLWLRTQIPEDLPTVEADRTRIRQVLINLLNNAVRFTHEGGITIAVTADEREVTVQVRDTGEGIDQADLPYLFQEFSQLDGTIRHQNGGSGLGLAISKKFVELHGGHMEVESVKGQGTTFAFTLPLQEGLGVSRLPPEWETWVRLAPAHGEARTVAVLAEEPGLAKFFERYLDHYLMRPVADVDEAWVLASKQLIHALIVVAPSGSAGWLALREIREKLPKVPIIVCTLRGGVSRTRPDGVHTYLVKPVSQAQILAALDELGAEVQRLLIVDDDPEVVRLLSRMVKLATRPYQISKAYTGAQALDLMVQSCPDAVVLDLLMPEVDGYTVLERMRKDERLNKIPVIVTSAKGMQEETVTAGLIGISQQEGLSLGEMMRCLKANLDALHAPALIHTQPAPPAERAGSRASR